MVRVFFFFASACQCVSLWYQYNRRRMRMRPPPVLLPDLMCGYDTSLFFCPIDYQFPPLFTWVVFVLFSAFSLLASDSKCTSCVHVNVIITLHKFCYFFLD